MRKVIEIAKKIEEKAPKWLKESYDNVGLMVGSEEKKVQKVLFSLDCTLDVIEEAVEKKADLIVTHHPLLFKKPSSINEEDLQGKKIIELIKNNISLYSCHTNLDNAYQGINDTIVEVLGFDHGIIMEPKNGDEKNGTGRLIKMEKEKQLNDIVKLVKDKLNIKNLRIARGKDTVKTIAVINGSGQDYFYMAKNMEADCIITGDTTYHFVSDFKEMNISIIDAGHFNTEYIPFFKCISFLEDEFRDIEFIYSDKSMDPYEFV